MQRVAAIDDMFSTKQKIYLSDIDGIDEKMQTLVKSSAIYIHSIHQVRWISAIYAVFSDKIITDLHGIVPEEESYLGNEKASSEMADVEREVFKYGKKFIAVSQKMVDWYNNKYSLGDDTVWIILPIFSGTLSSRRHLLSYKRRQVIYAGGMQRWQNPDLMVRAIKDARSYSYCIYTHEGDILNDLLRKNSIDGVNVKSGSKEQVIEEYSSSKLGFLLRDDHALNRVSCPTKLVEYLSNGVVPIVLSPYIGDFFDLGYRYVLYDDFVNKPINEAKIHSAANHNYIVAKEINKITADGIDHLKEIILNLSKKHQTIRDIDRSYIKAVLQGNELLILSEKHKSHIHILEHQITCQSQTISALQSSVVSLQSTISDMLVSKRWLLGEIVNKPKELIRHINKSDSSKLK